MTAHDTANALEAVLNRLYHHTTHGLLTIEDMRAMELGREALDALRSHPAPPQSPKEAIQSALRVKTAPNALWSPAANSLVQSI